MRVRLDGGEVTRAVSEDLSKVVLEQQLKQRLAQEAGKVGEEDTEI